MWTISGKDLPLSWLRYLCPLSMTLFSVKHWCVGGRGKEYCHKASHSIRHGGLLGCPPSPPLHYLGVFGFTCRSVTSPQTLHVPHCDRLSLSSRVDSSQRARESATKCRRSVLSTAPLVYTQVFCGSSFSRASTGKVMLLTHSLFSLSRSNGGNVHGGLSHTLKVTSAL